jgi:uncharacterized repeat protein (TIGR01451 family)
VDFVGDTSLSVSGVASAERTSIGYWLFKNVDIGEHNFTVFVTGEEDLPDGSRLSSIFSSEYNDFRGIHYGPAVDTKTTDFVRPVVQVSFVASELNPEPGSIVEFTILITNTGSVAAGQVRVEFVTTSSLLFVDDDVDSIGGMKEGDFTFLLPDLAGGEHSFTLTTMVDFETMESFINSTVVVDYADPSGTVQWNATRTLRLTLEVAIPMILPMEPFNGLPWAIVIIALLAMSSLVLSENAKYTFFLLFIPLYTKLRKKNILEHETRGLIRGYVIANPGDHFNSIRKALNLNNGTLAYHLHVLEREELIKSKRWGKFTRFYPYGMKIPENGSRYSEIQKLIIEKIRETPGITQKEIAGIMGVTKPTINYHINKLMNDSMVESRRLGIQIRYFIRDTGDNGAALDKGDKGKKSEKGDES